MTHDQATILIGIMERVALCLEKIVARMEDVSTPDENTSIVAKA